MATSEPQPSHEALVYCVIDPDGLAASFSCAVEEAEHGSQIVLEASDDALPVRIPFGRYLDLDAVAAALRSAASPTLRALARASALVAAVIVTCAPLRRFADNLLVLAG